MSPHPSQPLPLSVSAANEVKLTEAERVKMGLIHEGWCDFECCGCICGLDKRVDATERILAARLSAHWNTLRELQAAYREAIGKPESEHQQRRMEQLARDLEAALARLSAREPDNEAGQCPHEAVEVSCGVGGCNCPCDPCAPFRPDGVPSVLDVLADVQKVADSVAGGRVRAAAPVSGVPTEAVRELAERVRTLLNNPNIGHGWECASHRNHEASCTCWHDRLVALVQRAAETNPGPSRSDTEGGE